MPPRKRTFPRRRLPDLAAVLYGVLLVATLMIALPALGVLPVAASLAVLLVLKIASLLIVVLAVFALLSIIADEAWLAVRRWRVRRRRGRAGGWL